MPGHYPPWVSFQSQWLAAAGAACFALEACRLTRRGGGLVLRSLPVLFGLISLVPLAQHVGGLVVFHSDALLASAYLLAFSMAIVSGRRLAAEPSVKFIGALMGALLVAAITSVGIALAQWQDVIHSAFVVDLPAGGRLYANLAQPNHLATLLALGIVAAVHVHSRGCIRGASTALVIAYLGWGLVMTQSRTGWLMAALLGLWALRCGTALRLTKPAVLAAMALFVLGVLLWNPINDAIFFGSPQAPLHTRLQKDVRWHLWVMMWDAAWQRPWLGWGWQQVALAQQSVAIDHPPSGLWLSQSHNIILDLLIYNGVLVGGLVVVCVAVWAWNRVRWQHSSQSWIALAGIGCLMTHALLEYPLDYTYFLLPLGFLIGIADAESKATSAADGSAVARIYSAVLALLLAMLVWIGLEYVWIEQALRTQRFVMMNIGLSKVPESPVPEVWLLDQPREVHRFWRTPARSGLPPSELRWMRDVVTREPRPAAMLRYALAAGLNSEAEQASLMLQRLCDIHSPLHCDEARAAWREAQAHNPELLGIYFPGLSVTIR